MLRTPDAVACTSLSVGYGRPALAGLDLAVAPGQTLALLGSSGSGKTTLLNTIAGFVAPLDGQVWLDGQLVSGPGRLVPPERRRIGMVFQDHALWPHLSVLDTVAYPLRRAGAAKAEARRAAQDILEQLSLAPLAERRPGQLSGGEQQRVGLARALAGAPGLYLFDEPTAHLDASLRAQILDEVARRRAADGAAAIYATHDATEALAIADRVAVLHSGALAQAGPPAEVYAAPDDLTVAALTGPLSVLHAPVSAVAAGRYEHRGGPGPRHSTRHHCAGGTTVRRPPAQRGPALLVRPDWARLSGPAASAAGGDLPGGITDVRFRGPHTDYHVATPAGPLLIREAGPPRVGPGPVRWSLLRVRLMRDSTRPHDPVRRCATRTSISPPCARWTALPEPVWIRPRPAGPFQRPEQRCSQTPCRSACTSDHPSDRHSSVAAGKQRASASAGPICCSATGWSCSSEDTAASGAYAARVHRVRSPLHRYGTSRCRSAAGPPNTLASTASSGRHAHLYGHSDHRHGDPSVRRPSASHRLVAGGITLTSPGRAGCRPASTGFAGLTGADRARHLDRTGGRAHGDLLDPDPPGRRDRPAMTALYDPGTTLASCSDRGHDRPGLLLLARAAVRRTLRPKPGPPAGVHGAATRPSPVPFARAVIIETLRRTARCGSCPGGPWWTSSSAATCYRPAAGAVQPVRAEP